MPYAFARSGNALVGPLLLLLVAAVTEFSFHVLIWQMTTTTTSRDQKQPQPRHSTGEGPAVDQENASPNPFDGVEEGGRLDEPLLSVVNEETNDENDTNDGLVDPPSSCDETTLDVCRGQDSFPQIVGRAFGRRGQALATGLIALFCFCTTVGYGVLWRDLVHVSRTSPPTRTTGDDDQQYYYDSQYDDEPAFLGFLSDKNNIKWHLDDNDGDHHHHLPLDARHLVPWLFMVVVVTPLCAVPTVTSLQHVGAVSMACLTLLATCLVIQTLICLLTTTPAMNDDDNNKDTLHPWRDHFSLWPPALSSSSSNGSEPNSVGERLYQFVLDELWTVLPIFLYCYIGHFAIVPIANDLQSPTPTRIGAWLRSTTLWATVFYAVLGVAGSVYGTCRSCQENASLEPTTGVVSSNILRNLEPTLDQENDWTVQLLWMIERTCMAIALTSAFPMLILPARDVVVEQIWVWWWYQPLEEDDDPNKQIHMTTTAPMEEEQQQQQATEEGTPVRPEDDEHHLVWLASTTPQEEEDWMTGAAWPPTPPLWDEPCPPRSQVSSHQSNRHHQNNKNHSTPPPGWMRLLVAMVLFWSAMAIASCVDSIDVVWDLIGSSLAIALAMILPLASYLVFVSQPKTTTTRPPTTTRMGHTNEGLHPPRTRSSTMQDMDLHDHATRTTERGQEAHEVASSFDPMVVSEHDRDPEEDFEDEEFVSPPPRNDCCSRFLARVLIGLFVPIMIICTAKSCYRTFGVESEKVTVLD